MSVPQFLASAYRYKIDAGVTDVQTIINSVYAELIANGWTCTVGGSGLTPTTMLSPVRSDRIRFSLTLTRTAATTLTLSVIDDLNCPVTAAAKTINIDAGGSDIRYCTGALFCYISSNYSVSKRLFICGVFDNYPIASLADPYPGYFATDSLTSWYDVCAKSPETSDYETTGFASVQRLNNWNSDQQLVSMSGAYIFHPAEIQNVATEIMLGRFPQIVVLDDGIAFGTELIVPIDTGITGTFVVVSNDGTAGKLAFRKA
jgi:hypothetical protein